MLMAVSCIKMARITQNELDFSERRIIDQITVRR